MSLAQCSNTEPGTQAFHMDTKSYWLLLQQYILWKAGCGQNFKKMVVKVENKEKIRKLKTSREGVIDN